MTIRESIKFKPELVTKYIEKGYWTNETLYSHLEENAKKMPDSEAIIHPTGILTYKELKNQVDELTNGLMKLGLMKGDVVAVQLPNTLEFVTYTDYNPLRSNLRNDYECVLPTTRSS